MVFRAINSKILLDCCVVEGNENAIVLDEHSEFSAKNSFFRNVHNENLITILNELKNKTDDTNLIRDIDILEKEIQTAKPNLEKIKEYSKKILSKTSDFAFSFAFNELLKKAFGV